MTLSVDKSRIRMITDAFTENDFTDIFTLISAMSQKIEGLGKLNGRSFTNELIKMYGYIFYLSLENFPMFAFNICSVACGGQLNSEYLLNNILEKTIDGFHIEISRLIKT
jgi:hypothetical protein